MRLSETALREFKEIYRRVVGDELTDAEVLECALGVVKIIQLILQHYEKQRDRK